MASQLNDLVSSNVLANEILVRLQTHHTPRLSKIMVSCWGQVLFLV